MATLQSGLCPTPVGEQIGLSDGFVPVGLLHHLCKMAALERGPSRFTSDTLDPEHRRLIDLVLNDRNIFWYENPVWLLDIFRSDVSLFTFSQNNGISNNCFWLF